MKTPRDVSGGQERLHIIQLTPPSRGAIATLRIEGPGAARVVDEHFRARNGRLLRAAFGDRLVIGRFGGSPGEEVVVRSLSEDVVELHCHGGHAAVAMIERALVESGGEVVAWPDWVRRHEVDPIAAAAQIALAEARTERTAAILLDQYGGALRRAIEEIEAALQGGNPQGARRQIESLLARAPLGRHLVEPWRVVLAGPPNAGKSSLINALVGYPRTIVHPTPGTTRDAVTVQTAIDGWPVELSDTAGLRKAAPPVEQAGIAVAGQRLATADLVVLVFDLSTPWSEKEQALADSWPDAVVVHNKSDLPRAAGPGPPGIDVSALDGEGLDDVLDVILARLVPLPPPAGAAVPFTSEQVEMLRRGLRLATRG